MDILNDPESNKPEESNDEREVRNYKEARRLTIISRRAEILVWCLLALLPLIQPFLKLLIAFSQLGNLNSFVIVDVLSSYSSNIIGSAFLVILPFVFRSIFSLTPLEYLRRRSQSTGASISIGHLSAGANVHIGSEKANTPQDTVDRFENIATLTAVGSMDPRQLIAYYAERSSRSAERIYNRAGVYLLVGAIIAFAGLAVFYLRTRDLPMTTDYVEHGLLLLPGFGVLFFIEFVALFFLRQDRAAMDEYRYYDAVTRCREENVVILKMFQECGTIVSTTDVIKSMTIYSSAGKLSAGETIDILEARKNQMDELTFLNALAASIVGKKEKADEKK